MCIVFYVFRIIHSFFFLCFLFSLVFEAIQIFWYLADFVLLPGSIGYELAEKPISQSIQGYFLSVQFYLLAAVCLILWVEFVLPLIFPDKQGCDIRL